MTWRQIRLRLRTLPWLLLTLAVAVSAQDDVGQITAEEKVRVAVKLLRTEHGGATHELLVIGPVDIAIGDGLLPTTFAARTNVHGCAEELRVGHGHAVPDVEALVWTVNVDVLAASTNRIVLATTWERLRQDETGSPRALAGQSDAKITLAEGDRVLLDFTDETPSGCARSYALELTAEMAEDPAQAGRQIGHDLWLVHEWPDGERTSQHLHLTTVQGEEADFQFPHERLPALPGPRPSDSETELQVDVQGRVRARLRPDDTLDVTLETRRGLWYVSADGSGEHVGEGGEKFLNVQTGEVVRVNLPAATGSTQQSERYAHDLAGHSFAVVFRAMPLP